MATLKVLVIFLVFGVGLGQNVDPFGGSRREMVPAMFIFGDSLIDNGNNNNLPSLAKANYFPYGIDFNGGPTGRFCNGYTMVDEIAEQLGLPLIPAYSGASGDQVLNGVNYASAAAGILDITGRNFVGRIPFDQQIRNFQNTLDQITNNLGADDVARQEYSRQLTTLYNLGARKFVIAGLGEMGCIPSILAQSPAGHCSDSVNQLVQPFNENVKAMLSNFNANQLPGAKFIFIDVARMFREILTNSPAYGFSVINRGCCGIGRNRGQITCLPFQTPCTNREQYVFWDAFHPTEAVNVLMGRKAFNGDLSMVYPMNIEQLANLDIVSN
ncbi:GDSL-LIKE LIPASE/ACYLHYDROLASE-RELATED [Salix koriyanagi]|uniref:GDSL-LIKE LIPASE/ACYLHYDROLASE-RELATED n=1 Tax=Salix koriyanagi TaxID=2511006 RepID=A0A9Q0WAG8_9ROSI|nr:GDSL-LIKE LIPASE/ACYLHYDROLASE-RELATED [Salix koriyanagi]